MKIEFVYGDVTRAKTDLIVNSLGTYTDEYGAICYNIVKKAKSKELQEIIHSKGIAKVMDTFVTDSYELPCKQILHIVSPYRWEDDKNCTQLKKAYSLLVQKALEMEVKSIAIPFIGTGANGYSRNDVYESATSIIETYSESKADLKVLLVVFGKEDNKPSLMNRDSLGMRFHEREKRFNNIRVKEERDDGDYPLSNASISSRDSISKGTQKKGPREKRIRDLQEMIRMNQIFSEVDLSQIEDPGENIEGYNPAFHFFQYVQDKNFLSSQKLRTRFPDDDFFSYNAMSRFKGGAGKKLTKMEVYCLAIAVQMNVTEALLFMIFSGYSFLPSEEGDRIFHRYLESGHLPSGIVEFLDSFEGGSGWRMAVKKKLK